MPIENIFFFNVAHKSKLFPSSYECLIYKRDSHFKNKLDFCFLHTTVKFKSFHTVIKVSSLFPVRILTSLRYVTFEFFFFCWFVFSILSKVAQLSLLYTHQIRIYSFSLRLISVSYQY